MVDPPVAVHSQFSDPEQQREASLLGMWTFLATEVLFFGGLFAAYLVYRAVYPAAFAAASHHLDIVLGTVNTAILLTSSLTIALAVYYAQQRQRRAPTALFVATIVLGLVFLTIKGLEYVHKYEEHLVPGSNFAWEGADIGQAQLFFVLYFVMTGLHAAHMIIGIGVAAVMAWWAWRGRYLADDMPVELFGLYWHFVDIVWIFLFPLLYLIDR